MVTLVNQIVECIVTGLATAVFLLFFGKMGWLPFMVIAYDDPVADDESFG